MEKKEKIPKKNSSVSYERRLSVAEKLKIIKYTEKRIIHVASNYYEVSIPKIKYRIKEMKELIQVAKKWAQLHCKNSSTRRRNLLILFYIIELFEIL